MFTQSQPVVHEDHGKSGKKCKTCGSSPPYVLLCTVVNLIVAFKPVVMVLLHHAK